MLGYFAMFWLPEDLNAAAAAGVIGERLLEGRAAWKTVVHSSGFVLAVKGAGKCGHMIVPLPHQQGAIVGTLFEAGAKRPTNQLPEDVAGAVSRSLGRSLIRTHWGSYVLLMRRRPSDTVAVLRGPMSKLACYWTVFQGVTLVFSSIEDCVKSTLIRFSTDWDRVRAQAAGGDYLGRRTSLIELQALLAGDRLLIERGNHAIESCWNPAHLPVPDIRNVDCAARLLADVTHRCLTCLISSHRRVLLKLSGGLDSSIVLASLARGGNSADVVSVNFCSSGSGDERKFARSMSALTGTRLIERERVPDLDLRRFLRPMFTVNAPVSFTAFHSEPILIELAHENCATAILSGEMGDDIFGHAPAPGVLAECLGTLPCSGTFVRAARDYAILTRVSIWKAIAQALSYKRWQQARQYWSYYQYKQMRGFSNSGSLASANTIRWYEEQAASRYVHPWFCDMSRVPRGRTMLVWSLVQVTSSWFDSPFAGKDADLFISPLASQPIVEIACRIPSRYHFRHGENAAVAKRAFEGRLSKEVLDRGTGKGGPDMWIRNLIGHNREFLREVFLDGILVREGILDRARIETALSPTVTNSRVGTAELIMQLYLEAWVRTWEQAPATTARSSIACGTADVALVTANGQPY